MTPPAIVADLGRRGVKLRVVGDRLQYAPRDLVGEAELAIIRAHKPALLEYLAPPEPGIVIDRPDQARMMAAVAQLPEGPGDADETGLDSPPEFRPLDLTAPDCPAWVFDDSLTFRPSDLRSALEANLRMGG
jgi:hypothetical protein